MAQGGEGESGKARRALRWADVGIQMGEGEIKSSPCVFDTSLHLAAVLVIIKTFSIEDHRGHGFKCYLYHF